MGLVIFLAIYAINVNYTRYKSQNTFNLKAEEMVVHDVIGLGKENIDGTPTQYWLSYAELVIYESKSLQAIGLPVSLCQSTENPSNTGVVQTIVPGRLPTDGAISQTLWCNGTRARSRYSERKPGISIAQIWTSWEPVIEL